MASPRLRCACAALALAMLVGVAQAQRLPVRRFDTGEGLASARVNSIVSDGRGFLWFATIDGLNRFDGVRFETFGVADGLPSSSCAAVRVTHDGAVWVATERGLARLDPDATGTRPRFTAVHVGSRPADDSVLTLFEDSQRRVWLGTEGGLWRMGPGGAIGAVALGAGRQLPVYAITEDRAGSLWLGTGSGLIRRTEDGAVERYRVRTPAMSDDRTPGVHVDRGGRLWVGSVEEHVLALMPPAPGTRLVAEGVALWDAAGPAHAADGSLRLPAAPGELIAYGDDTGFPAHGVWWGIGEDSRGNLWFGAHRLVRFDGERFTALGASQGFPDDLAPVAEDRAGNLWFGSQAAGAVRLAPRGLVSFDTRDGLDTSSVFAVMEDGEGTIHATTYAGMHVLNRLAGDRFVAVRPKMPDRIPLAGAWGINQIELVDRDGRWWYATSLGAAHYPRVLRFEDLATTVPDFFGVPEGLPGRDVLRMFEDSRGDVWIGTMSPNGIARWDRASNRVVAVRDPALPTSPVWAFAEDGSGGVWLGYDDGRLVRLPRGSTDGLRVFGTADGLPGPAIWALLVDHLGRLWVATSGGVVRLDEPASDRPRVTRYTTATGLTTDLTLALVEDARGRISVGTMHGVDRIDPVTGAVGHLSTADGLPSDLVQDGLRDRRGSLWFATVSGLARLDPEDDRAIAPPIAYLMSIRAGGTVRPLAMGGARSAAAISLAASDGQLDLEFTSPSFESGLAVEYQYKLAGADRDWGPFGRSREVHYAHLAPGHYRFLVRARYPGGEVSAPASVVVDVRPPLWRRPWFIALVAALLALLGWRLYRWRVQHLIAVERVRTRIATDLHDDLGASLSRISILAEVAARGAGGRPVGEVVDDIGKSARELVDVASDIVWSTDPARDDLAQVLVRLRGFAGDVLESRGITWALHAPADPDRIRLDPDQRRHLYLMCKEAINNVARHAGAQRVEIQVRRRGGELEVVVEDDGRGLDPAATPNGNGLRNMRARAAAARGSLVIESPPGGGTRVTLRLPIDR